MRAGKLPLVLAALVIVALALATFGAARVLAAPDDADDGRGQVADPTGWSPIVYPLQRLPLTFSHRKHAARGTACASCHAGAATSQSAVDDLLPVEAVCKTCHPIDRSAAAASPTATATAPTCGKCHPGYQPGAVVQQTYVTPSPLKFAHAQHAKTPCAQCHGDMAGVDLATTQQLPTMATCLSCHPTGGEVQHCADCHLAQNGGLIDTHLEQGDLIPRQSGLGDAHGPGFSERHAQEARQPSATCNACHDQSECLACHQGVTKPTDFHPGNYVLTHPIDARRGKPECGACHREESFCVSCHERSGVGPRVNTDFNDVDPSRRFHPANWAARQGGLAANLHAQEARRNVTTCASCHRDEDCMTCHTAEAGQGNVSPHPKDWRGSARCRALDRSNRRMCLRCHIAQNELGCDWSAR